MGFSRDKSLSTLTSGNTLFDWDNSIEKIRNANIGGCETIREKQLIVLGYFFEMCYDICLAPEQNVSVNPGFEQILGVINTNK